jgi:hypothetical protein
VGVTTIRHRVPSGTLNSKPFLKPPPVAGGASVELSQLPVEPPLNALDARCPTGLCSIEELVKGAVGGVHAAHQPVERSLVGRRRDQTSKRDDDALEGRVLFPDEPHCRRKVRRLIQAADLPVLELARTMREIDKAPVRQSLWRRRLFRRADDGAAGKEKSRWDDR